MRTPARIRETKREYMRRARLDPEKRTRWNRLKRESWQTKWKPKHQAYKQKIKVQHFFLWRAQNWRKGRVTARELAALWKSQRGRCALSGRKLNREAHLDHVIPRSKGGTGEIGNLRWLDPQINMMRHNFSDQEFGVVCAQIAEWIGRRIVAAVSSEEM